MAEFLIYGKVNKRCYFNHKWHEPQPTFKALNYFGERVSRLADADSYATKEDAQEKINKAKRNHEKIGLKPDDILFEIRKAK